MFVGSSTRSADVGAVTVDESRRPKSASAASVTAVPSAAVGGNGTKSRQPLNQQLQGYYCCEYYFTTIPLQATLPHNVIPFVCHVWLCNSLRRL